jgi:hypothetical protein
MSQQPIAELARLLLRQLYESSDAGSRQTRVIAKSPTAEAVLEFAVDNEWVVIEGKQDVSLTAAGLAIVKKSLS